MDYKYGQCDSYFVMEEDTKEASRWQRQHMAELTQRRNHETQLGIAEELSQLDKAEYGEEMLMHMTDLEMRTLPDVASIDIQSEIEWYMRPYLLDFLIEAHLAFGLLPETLFLAVNILDRYCSKRVVYRRHYQLVGCVSLLVAAKYGECSKKVPQIKELANMCCGLYDEVMFLQMERHVMETLDWFIGHPTADAFLLIALDDDSYQPDVESMARYIAEIAMFHREFVSKRSSELARASLALARLVLNQPQPEQYEWAAQYDPQTLVRLSELLGQPSTILRQKYSLKHNYAVATTLEKFLEQWNKARENPAAPPTPPKEIPCPSVPYAPSTAAAPWQTPTKSQFSQVMPNGVMTPPITPDIDRCAPYKPAAVEPSFQGPAPPCSLSRPQSQGAKRSYYEAILAD